MFARQCTKGRAFAAVLVAVACITTILLVNADDSAECNGDGVPDAAFGAFVHGCTFATGLAKPRSVKIDANGDVLVLERSRAQVTALWDDDGDGVADGRATIFTAPGINHGLALHGGHLYTSSDTTVYRAAYTAGQRGASTGGREVVVKNMNADGRGGAPMGHWSRTLAFGPDGRLYVSVGSLGNVDASSYRARVRRFDLSGAPLPAGGFDFGGGEVFADGLRNEVGLAFDARGVLWGVENGADRLVRNDLGTSTNCGACALLSIDAGPCADSHLQLAAFVSQGATSTRTTRPRS